MNRNLPTRFGALVMLLAFAQLMGIQSAFAQARATVASMRTQYNTVKTQAKPEGELKKKFDSIDAQIARAAQLGRTGDHGG